MSIARDRQRVLIVGKDARTDAIAAACRDTSDGVDLYGVTEAPHPGLLEKCVDVFVDQDLTDPSILASIIEKVKPDLAIIGPEEPLDAGFVDELERHNVPTFGPTADLAQIESSKSWTRRLLDKHDIPGNPEYRVFTSDDGLRRYMEQLQSFVIKPDGLTAGKGVRVFGEHVHSIEEALEYALLVLRQHESVQIEERLEGQEFSLQTITDGDEFIHMPLVQDHKRAFEDDLGPNTGGMGSYSCKNFSLPFLEVEDVAAARAINERVIQALHEEVGKPYRGVLYGGFIAVADGIRLIEYNARFGDPEAMNVLPLLKADFVELCSAVAGGTLNRVSWEFEAKATVCKYLVPRNYPQASAENQEIVVPDEDRDRDELKWYWAACEKRKDGVYMTSSRSGAFVGIGDSLAEAEQLAERAAQGVSPHEAVRHRSDIGQAEIIAKRIRSMESVRQGALAPPARSAA